MWIASTLGWFDVVKDRDSKKGVIIKARCKADIWNVYRQFGPSRKKGRGRRFKMTKPMSHEKWDYRWGIKMEKRAWAAIIYRLTMRIDYPLFKTAVHEAPDQHNKTSAYLTIWSTMLRVQQHEEAGSPNGEQRYFSDYQFDWRREIDLANDRFEAEQGIPTKTIKSVVAENLEANEAEARLIERYSPKKDDA